MAKQANRIREERSGTIVSEKDSPGGSTNDIQAGDEIVLMRRRQGESDLDLVTKRGIPAKLTLPSNLAAVADAFALEISVTPLFRTKEAADLTNAQKAAVWQAQTDKELIQVDENPWA